MKKSNQLALGVAILSTLTFANAADIVGANSAKAGGKFIKVGESNVWAPFGIHTKGRAGIAIANGTLDTSKKVDFQGLANNSKTTELYDEGQTVNQLHKPFRANKPWWDFHKDVGSFNFVKVGSGDVWFGEWSEDGASGNFTGRQVYYVGDKSGTSLPGGTATYTTYGINKFNGKNLMKGELDANFATKTLKGDLKRSGVTLKIDAKIKNDASFKGTAKFNATRGNSKGHFFGNQASSLAGIAEFSDKNKNTAFGGKKD